jgi:DNA-binding NtrC family response regulator
VTKRYRVLIADRNPRIRDFLSREFTLAGYIVRLAETGEQLLKMVFAPIPLDLLILDPDFPDADLSVLTQKLQERVPQLPVVLHTLDMEAICARLPLNLSQCVEKNGCSVENLKKTVAGILSLRQQASTEQGL